MSDQASRFRYRYDLDGLRGIAIAFVVIFHVFVGKVSGGVDVFLLLSGFFFLGSQLRYAAKPDASLNPWWPIWRTIRRLAPGLVLVLASTTAAVWLLTPSLRDLDFAKEIIASLLYYQNWQLVELATGYQAASDSVSPLQHLWSMSVQGQFYILAIALGLLLAVVVRFLPTEKRSVTTVYNIALPFLLVATVASFAYAVYLHQVDQQLNYYSTFSRMWELTLGGVLVIVAGRIRFATWLQSTFTVLGVAMVLVTGLLFDGAKTFPSYEALFPIGGAVLVALGGGPAANVLGNRFMRWLGNIGYPLYLWHWSILIISTIYQGQQRPTIEAGVVVIAVSLLIADLTHRLVEKPLRQHAKRPTRSDKRLLRATQGLWRQRAALSRALGGVAVAGVAAALLYVPNIWREEVETVQSTVLDPVNYPGAAALTGAPVPEGVKFQPNPYTLASTVSPAWTAGCMSLITDDPNVLAFDRFKETDPQHCVFGDKNAEKTVVLVGGSHAEQWTAPLDELGKQHHFKILPLVRQSCPIYAQELDGAFSPECTTFNQHVMQRILEIQPDLVISNSTRPLLEKARFIDEVPASYPTFWNFLAQNNIPFMGLRDNPWFLNETGGPRMVSQCVEETGDVHNIDCGHLTENVYAPEDPAEPVLSKLPNMHEVDTSPWFCQDGFCPAVIGNIYVYRDGNHMSDDFARTLAPLLWPHIEPLLNLPRPAKSGSSDAPAGSAENPANPAPATPAAPEEPTPGGAEAPQPPAPAAPTPAAPAVPNPAASGVPAQPAAP